MVRHNKTPQYGPKKGWRPRKNEVQVGSKLYHRDSEGKVTVHESDKDPYMAEPDEIPEKLRSK